MINLSVTRGQTTKHTDSARCKTIKSKPHHIWGILATNLNWIKPLNLIINVIEMGEGGRKTLTTQWGYSQQNPECKLATGQKNKRWSFLENKLEGVMVNFRCQPDWATECVDVWSKIILWGCCWMKLTFEWKIGKDCLPYVSMPHPINWRSKENKDIFLPSDSNWKINSFWVLDWNWHHWLSWFLGFGLGLELRSFPVSVGSVACQQLILGILSLYNHVGAFGTKSGSRGGEI